MPTTQTMVSKLLRKILSDVAMWSFEKINNKAQRIWNTNLKMGEKLFKSSTKPIPNARMQQINSVVVDIVSTLEQNRKMYTNARIMQPKKTMPPYIGFDCDENRSPVAFFFFIKLNSSRFSRLK